MWRLKTLMETAALRAKDAHWYCCLSPVIGLGRHIGKGDVGFSLPKRDVSKAAKKGKMQVPLCSVHEWITLAESYSRHYLELDSGWFAASAGGCHTGASAFVFPALSWLNEDPHCYLFLKSLIHSAINYSTDRRKIQPGKATRLISLLGREKMPPLHWDMPRSNTWSCSLCLWCSYILSRWAKPTWTHLALFDCFLFFLFFSRVVLGCGSAECQLLANTLILVTLSSLLEK